MKAAMVPHTTDVLIILHTTTKSNYYCLDLVAALVMTMAQRGWIFLTYTIGSSRITTVP